MSPNRASITYPTISDVDSSNATTMKDSNNRVSEIAAQPDFYIFTSLLWIRRSDRVFDYIHQLEELSKTPASEEELDFLVPDESQPDLGLLRFHRDRLVAAADALQWKYIQALERSERGLSILRSSIAYYLRCLPSLPLTTIECRKIRVMINKSGMISMDSTIIDCSAAGKHPCLATSFSPRTLDMNAMTGDHFASNSKGLPTFDRAQVFIDNRPTCPSLFTTHKTSQRILYNAARKRANISASSPTEKEVLIYNNNGEVMEASLCTVYFFRNGVWVTPAAICGGNLGVTRRLALDKGLCQQGTIEVADLRAGEWIWLSNGARGFFIGQICHNAPNGTASFENRAST